MTIHRYLLSALAAFMLSSHGLAAAGAEEPGLACYRSAAAGSTEPHNCDLALQVAARLSDPRATAAAYSNRGLVLARGGRLELALKDLDAALTLLPRDPDVLTNRAGILLRMGRTAEALEGYDLAAAARPDEPAIFFNRAFAHRALGNLRAAEADLQQAARLLDERLRRRGPPADKYAAGAHRAR